ncbi:MAG: exodeoxyribonuclease VII large subunit [Rhizobiales bacterium]|nr:exodeoxyribonuclease VII large subunit [Hyphomicrobiales bacterium]
MNQPAGANLPEYSVSEISAAVKRVVEDNFGYVRVRGEISGYRGPHSSGHAYFTLKDERARMDAVVWKTTFQRLRFKPQEGLEVIATGKLTTFPGSSKYQIVIDALEPAGAGALMALIEERRKKLAGEGLFDEARKKALPYLPRIIGVVTSPTGAVIRDILHRLADRCPARVIVWPVRVQGETSAAEVTAAIEGFNRMTGPSRPDVLIVARGGGSLEDLWSFNEESVVRAAAASLIPLISAIGHETDFTLIDFAADRRAPTPTAAAEMAVPVRAELIASVDSLGARHLGAIARRIERDRKELRGAARALPQPESLFAIPRRTFDELASRLGRGLIANARVHRVQFERAAARLSVAGIAQMVTRCRERAGVLADRAYKAVERRLERKRAQLDSVARALPLVSYRDILARGFAVVRAGGVPVRSVSAVPPGTRLDIELHDGHVGATADGTAGRKKAPGGSQGSLF